jgi:hypothetical protein
MAWPSVEIGRSGVAIGRNPASGLCLLHPEVRYNHAVLHNDGAGICLFSVDAERGSIAADSNPMARLGRAGDAARLGPFILTVSEVAENGDFTLSVAQPDHSPQDEAALTQRYLHIFDATLPNVRLWALLLSCVIVGVFFAWPLLSQPSAPRFVGATQPDAAAVATGPWHATLLWEVGAISHAHSGFAANCLFCHQTPFVPIASTACLACHRNVGQHADPRTAPVADLRPLRCENCHHEHKGQTIATRDSQADCVACHGNIKRIAPETSLRDALDFGTEHPQFRPALVLDAGLRTTKRFAIGDLQAEDHANVRFTHATHLKLPKLMRPISQEACAGCHIPVPGGATFKPVQFDAACASCHTLQFEPLHPEWRLPHGHPEEVASRIAGYYARAALAGEVFAKPGTEPFYKPGAPPPPPPPTGTDLVTYKTAEAMMSSIARSTCGQCHVTLAPAADQPASAWRVAPVFVPDRYMPSALFSHAAHATSSCETCHKAQSSDLGAISLLPDIAICRACHAGEAGAPQRVASSCASCHRFHNDMLPLMTPVSEISATVGKPPMALHAKELQ